MGTGDGARERMIAEVARYARSTHRQVTVRQFCKASGIEEGRVHELFPGGIGELLAAAGLGQRVSRRVRIDFEGLMSALDEVARLIGRVPTPGDMDRVGRVTARTYYDRMQNWGKVREEYERWKKATGDGQKAGGNGQGASGAGGGAAAQVVGRGGALLRRGMSEGKWHRKGVGARRQEWRETGGAGQGPEELAAVGACVSAPLQVPGMLFAPTCEAGVVYLFGLLARELGFVVEKMGTAFPDCVALERVGKDRWRRVRVEFEFRSSNFRAHGHDAAGCDLIVCWEDDWKESPVRVRGLKGEVSRWLGAEGTPCRDV